MARDPVEELTDAKERLQRFAQDYDLSTETKAINNLWRKAKEIGKL